MDVVGPSTTEGFLGRCLTVTIFESLKVWET